MDALWSLARIWDAPAIADKFEMREIIDTVLVDVHASGNQPENLFAAFTCVDLALSPVDVSGDREH